MLTVQLRRVLLCATVITVGCGEEAPPPPAPTPEEFDDPFADEAKDEGKVEAVVEAKADTKVALAEPAEAPVAPAVADADAPGPESAPAPAVEPDRAAGKKKTGAEAPVPKDKSPKPASPAPQDRPPAPESPVPADSPPPPTPAPAPEPAAAPTPPAAPAAPALPDQARFAGTFRYSGGEAQRTNLGNAIEAAAQELNALIRPIGRKRLTEANPIREQMTFAVDGDKVTATFAPGRTVAGTLGGPAVPWTSDSGKPVTVAFSLVKGRLVMDFKAEDGGRRSTFTLDESGARLTMSVTVTSDRLTNPLKYALSYRRN